MEKRIITAMFTTKYSRAKIRQVFVIYIIKYEGMIKPFI